MPDTPPALRGRFYSTHSYARCPEFHRCRRCQMCTHYNVHNAICVACEGTKPGRKHTCNENQLIALDTLEKVMGRPVFDINAEPGKVLTQNVMSTAYDDEYTKLIRELG